MDIIYKNWKKYQVIIILLILLFIFMIYYKIHSGMKENFDGNEIPTDVKEISSKTLSEVFFIKNFPNQADEMKMIWEGKMDDNRYISFWQRQNFNDEYFSVGQVSLITNLPSKSTDLSITNQSGLQFLVKGGVSPVDFEKIWDSKHLANLKPLSIWKVIPPNNYYTLGDIIVDGFDKPNPDVINIKCLPIDILETHGEINDAVWKNPQSKEIPEISPKNALSVWNVGDYGFFIANDSYVKPDPKVKKVWSIKDKIIENQEYDPKETDKKLKIILKV